MKPNTLQQDLAAQRKQDYGKNPTKVRTTDKYKSEYIGGFVDKWDQLIDWDARAESEGSFFIDVLRERGCKRVLDVAAGTGFHSVRLLEAGFDVVSADGSPVMLAKAFENARKRGHILRTVQADWRWLNRDVHAKFDAIICLGNSFTHLHSEKDRRKTLAEFYAALRHDGILILDQRNYDMILDQGFSTKHTYYYCGDKVKAEPEYMDDGLARFRYSFPDESVYYLNMFPLRRSYVEKLILEVGFPTVKTYGDFQESFRQEEPDFFIHIAEKRYPETGQGKSTSRDEAVKKARDYYNSADADNFYHHIWGGEDIHIGLYEDNADSIKEASRKTVDRMCDHLGNLGPESRVLDIGSGYAGSARAIAQRFGCKVSALNLSEVENDRARDINRSQGLDSLIEVIDGSFDALPFEDNSFDVVWSQDAILHASDRRKVFEEVDRVLKPGGKFIFTDILEEADVPSGALEAVYARIHLDNLGSLDKYRSYGNELGWAEVSFDDQSIQLPRHYQKVFDILSSRESELKSSISVSYIDKMKAGLTEWVKAGNRGFLRWGIMEFQKPSGK